MLAGRLVKEPRTGSKPCFYNVACSASLSKQVMKKQGQRHDRYFAGVAWPPRAQVGSTRQTHEPECIPRKISQRFLLSTWVNNKNQQLLATIYVGYSPR